MHFLDPFFEGGFLLGGRCNCSSRWSMGRSSATAPRSLAAFALRPHIAVPRNHIVVVDFLGYQMAGATVHGVLRAGRKCEDENCSDGGCQQGGPESLNHSASR